MASSCEAWKELIVLRALGDPDGESAPGLDEHLRTCPACREYQAHILEATDRLPLAVPRVKPPAHLRDAVLSTVRSDAGGPGAQIHSREAQTDDDELGEPFGLGRLISREARGVWQAAFLIVLLLGNLAFAYAVWEIQSRNARLSQRLAQTEERIARLEADAKILGAEAAMTGQGGRLLSIVPLSATDAAADAFGKAAVFETADGFVVFVAAANLKTLSGEQAYQLWLIDDGRRTDGRTFRVDTQGAALHVFRSRGTWRFQALGITLEPDDQGHAPRGVKVLGGTVAGEGSG